jgi:hypothetical protein
MEYIDKLVEKLKEIAQRIIETLLGPQEEPEAELIPIPVEDPYSRRLG